MGGVFRFEPVLKEKVWGGRRLERLGKPLAPGVNYGESWEICDLPMTSAGGGGGGSARSVIVDGPGRGDWAGRTVNDLVRTMGADLLGTARAQEWENGPAFPLLVKYLDAAEHLSVQAHPSPEYAAAHGDAHLKTESWVVVDAELGACVYRGFSRAVTADEVRAAADEGRLEPLLGKMDSRVGDCHTLPSGTCHALGAGTLVAEVQTPSDTTFRVYDWAAEYGRAGRELHLDAAIASMGLGAEPGGDGPVEPVTLGDGATRGVLAETEFYGIERVLSGAGEAISISGDRCVVLMVLGGSVRVEEEVFERGATALIAANAVDGVRAVAGGDADVLVVRPG